MPQAIHISPIDNVVVALHPIAKGTLVEVDGLAVTALEDIPQGHKMAVKPIKNGENVIKYGFPIGHATADAAPGTWMHTHNVHTNLSGEVEYSYNPAPDLAPLPKVEPETFMGFRRKDGRAAIRNEIWIIPTVGCVNDIAKKMVADNQDLVTGSIEGLYTFTHPFGCSQTGHDHAQTRKLLAALVRHPNAAAVLVLHLGCENLQHDQFVEELGEYDHDRVKFLTCQDVDDEFTAARDILKELAAYAGQFQREPIPVSDLVVGMKCGGSDGYSGLTANPLVGAVADRVVAAAHGAVHGGRKLRMVQDQFLHPLLHLIGELVALGVEDLDAVVSIGVVGGGDDDTGVRLLLHRQKGHRRGGDGAQGHHVAAYGADTGHQGRLQHIGGNAGVLADGDERTAALLLRQDGGHRLSHMKCQLRRQGLPRYAADAVGAKEFSHIPILLFVIIPAVPGA